MLNAKYLMTMIQLCFLLIKTIGNTNSLNKMWRWLMSAKKFATEIDLGFSLKYHLLNYLN